jgi:hypothetical protein
VSGPRNWLISPRTAVRAAVRPAIAANLIAVVALCLSAVGPAPVASAAKWVFNVYDSRAVRWQDPDYNACTAASTLMMLNMASYRASQDTFMVLALPAIEAPAPQISMRWRADVSLSQQTAILAYERANMTMLETSRGSDPHGWRNALNYFGWGSNGAGIYRDSAYTTFDAAARAVVSSIARYQKPVGILGLAGAHAQIVTGYVVRGQDPRVGSSFTIVGIYLTDSLRSRGIRNLYVSAANWRAGVTTVRFTPYRQADSPYQDPIDGRVGYAEWYGRWVIVDAVQ